VFVRASGLNTLIEKRFGGVPRLHRLHFDEPPAWSFEKIREGEAWEEIEREKAHERQSSGGVDKLPEGKNGSTREKAHERQSSGGADKLREGEKGETSEKVGEKIGPIEKAESVE